jgi:hypothetical protein
MATRFVTNPRRPSARRNPDAATPRAFLSVLRSKLTQYDMKLSVRQPNMYRLGHYLAAAERVEKDMGKSLDSTSPAALEKLRQSLHKRFEMPFAPASAVERQIDAYLTKGTMPSLVRKNNPRRRLGGVEAVYAGRIGGKSIARDEDGVEYVLDPDEIAESGVKKFDTLVVRAVPGRFATFRRTGGFKPVGPVFVGHPEVPSAIRWRKNASRNTSARDPFAAVRRDVNKEVARYAEVGGTFATQRLMDAAYRVYNKHMTATGEQLDMDAILAEIREAEGRAHSLYREQIQKEMRGLKEAHRETQRHRTSRRNPGVLATAGLMGASFVGGLLAERQFGYTTRAEQEASALVKRGRSRATALAKEGRGRAEELVSQGRRRAAATLVKQARSAARKIGGSKASRRNPRRSAKDPSSREEFDLRYWGKDYLSVPAMTRREFYSDWRESGLSFTRYKRETSSRSDY